MFLGENRPGCGVNLPPHTPPSLKKELSSTFTPFATALHGTVACATIIASEGKDYEFYVKFNNLRFDVNLRELSQYAQKLLGRDINSTLA